MPYIGKGENSIPRSTFYAKQMDPKPQLLFHNTSEAVTIATLAFFLLLHIHRKGSFKLISQAMPN